MILSLIIILIVFTIVLTTVWVWFFRNETAFCEKLYASAILSFDSGKYKRARTLFAKITLLLPNFKDAKHKLGLTYIALGEYEQAVDCFENILKSNPRNFYALLQLAFAYQYMEKYDKAEEAYNKALKENEKSGDCVFGLGFIRVNQQKYAEALEFFTKAEETYSDKVKLAFYINKCHDELSTYDEETQGQEIIDGYLKIVNEPNLPKEFNISLATAYAKMGQIESAMTYCKKSLSDNSEDIESYKLLGLIQLVQKDFSTTKGTLSTALHLQPYNNELHNLLSYTLCQQIENCSLGQCRARYHELIQKFLK